MSELWMTYVVMRLHVESDPLQIHGQEVENVRLVKFGFMWTIIVYGNALQAPHHLQALLRDHREILPLQVMMCFGSIDRNIRKFNLGQVATHLSQISIQWAAWEQAMCISTRVVKQYRYFHLCQ